jgi:hypothetical protein
MFVPRMNAATEVPPASAPVTSAPAAPAATPTPAAVPAAAAVPEDQKKLLENPDTLNARLAEAREAEQRKLFKGLNVKDMAEASAKLAELKKLQDAQLSEQERVAKQLAELQPKAERAGVLEQTVREYLAIEEGLVPEGKKGLLDLAPPAEQPEARLKWIASAKAKGLFTEATTPVPAAAPTTPANTRAGITPPPTPAPMNSTRHPRDMTPEEFKRYEEQKKAEHTAR